MFDLLKEGFLFLGLLGGDGLCGCRGRFGWGRLSNLLNGRSCGRGRLFRLGFFQRGDALVEGVNLVQDKVELSRKVGIRDVFLGIKVQQQGCKYGKA